MGLVKKLLWILDSLHEQASMMGDRTYSPAVCIGVRKTGLRGAPEPHYAHVHAAPHAPNQRLLEEGRESDILCRAAPRVEAAVALHLMHYNFARVHQTLTVTPAMEAGVSDHVWKVEEIVGLLF